VIYDVQVARRKITTTVYLEPEQDEMLKALSERTGVPVAAYIRQGIDMVLEAHRGVLPGQLSLFEERPQKRRRPRRSKASPAR
jgi:hypothetical protein